MPYRSVIRSADEGWVDEFYDDTPKPTSPVGRIRPNSFIRSGDEGWQSNYLDEAGNEWDESHYQQQSQKDFDEVLAEAQGKGLKGVQLVGYIDQQLRDKKLGFLSYTGIDQLINRGIVSGNDTLPSGENLYGYADRNRAIAQDKKSGGIFNNGAMFDQFMLSAAGMLAGGFAGGAFSEAGAAGGTTAGETAAVAAPTATGTVSGGGISASTALSLGLTGGTLLSGLSDKGADVGGDDTAPPPPPTPEPMPTRNDSAMRTARRQSAARQRQRRGRASTIMTALNSEDGGVLGA